ncbi:uncharacterized protein LOC107494332 [Arachis duranensis]|uniref:Uncharacterized protein LOC107494332 n=1 Tax=Arachis duranensis TaxID=130453 RepID=A0A6P4DMQ9_ARADU|nr:uncharacterized protein LOC107494332 [Arachis duranensis]
MLGEGWEEPKPPDIAMQPMGQEQASPNDTGQAMDEQKGDARPDDGAVGKAFSRACKEYIRVHKPDIVALQETRCSGDNAKEVIKNLGLNNFILVEARGYSGGIWILWRNDNINIKPIQLHSQYIHAIVEENNKAHWLLSIIYGSPREMERREAWEEIREFARNNTKPWLMVGDFNAIANINEKKGGAPADRRKCLEFANWISDCNLIDMEAKGSKFTWRGAVRDNRDRVFERLDRGLCNSDWRIQFPEAYVMCLTRTHSDHHPLLIKCNGDITVNRNRPYRFETFWMQHQVFKRCRT